MTREKQEEGNPWKRLANHIIDKARKDCSGRIEKDAKPVVKALIQYDAEHWLSSDPWCKFLLDCVLPWEYDADQYQLVLRERRRRKKSYLKHLPRISPTERLPICALAKLIGIHQQVLEQAIRSGQLRAAKDGKDKWIASVRDVAEATAVGGLRRR